MWRVDWQPSVVTSASLKNVLEWICSFHVKILNVSVRSPQSPSRHSIQRLMLYTLPTVRIVKMCITAYLYMPLHGRAVYTSSIHGWPSGHVHGWMAAYHCGLYLGCLLILFLQSEVSTLLEIDTMRLLKECEEEELKTLNFNSPLLTLTLALSLTQNLTIWSAVCRPCV